MTHAERLRIERRIDALIAEAMRLRLGLTVKAMIDSDEPLNPAYWNALAVLRSRADTTRAQAEAVGSR